jgi:hypothetical protein
MAFVVFKHMIGFEKETTTLAAIAYGICPLLPIRNGMDQSRLRRLPQDIFCLFLADLPAQTIIHDIMAQLAKVEADLQRMLAIR